jgi:cob(I)alamin adenosyltransferase
VEGEVKFKMPTLPDDGIKKLENAMDKMDAKLEPLRNFILPGGHISVAHCHVARTVCRRAERHTTELAVTTKVDPFIVMYLNRLSDYLFVLARMFGAENNAEEIPWNGQ